jgi:hypothetical protein
MARKPTDYVQFKLRIREALRRKIERAAEKKKISTNAEAVERIEESFREEERHEEFLRDIEEQREEVDEQYRQHLEEQARMESEHQASLRDTQILNMMVENRHPGALLLRVIARELAENPEWAVTEESQKAFAERLHWIVTNNEFPKEWPK